MKNLCVISNWLSAKLNEGNKNVSNQKKPDVVNEYVIKAGITDGNRFEYFNNYNAELMNQISKAKIKML